MKVLFLGNSFTYFNDLPAVFSDLCRESGFPIEVSSITKGGASLREFLNPENRIGGRLDEALRESWDAVIFQEQSFRPVGNPQSFLSAAEELSGRFCDSKRYFYQTWAYRDGSKKLKEKDISYEAMHRALKESYQTAAEACGGACVPVGDAFFTVHERYSEIDLYQPDDYHPSPAGTYLAACLFVAVVFGISPDSFPAALDLEPKTASVLRKIAVDCLSQ